MYNKDFGFVKLHNIIGYEKTSKSASILFTHLCMLHDDQVKDNGKKFITFNIDDVSEEINVSKQTLNVKLKELIDLGLIERVCNNRSKNKEYIVHGIKNPKFKCLNIHIRNEDDLRLKELYNELDLEVKAYLNYLFE